MSDITKSSALILAVGRGVSENVFLKEVLFSPICGHISATCVRAGIPDILAVTNYDKEEMLTAISSDAATAEVFPVAATADGFSPMSSVVDAISSALSTRSGNILMLRGDIPLFDHDTIIKSFEKHLNTGNAVTILTTQSSDQDRGGAWFRAEGLLASLKLLVSSPPAERCPLLIFPDTIQRAGGKVGSYMVTNPEFACRASSAKDIYTVTSLLNRQIIERHMQRGVEFLSTDGVLISRQAVIGAGTKILPGTIIKGKTVIGRGCEIGPSTLISNSVVGDCSKINSSQCYSSEIAEMVTIGPYCHVRPNSKLKKGVHLGDFVEIKNSVIGEATHVSHLTYVGDSDVGERVNFGCGVVTVNYNGKTKARCTIGDDAFVGCNTNLIAPVTVGSSSYIAAGSTITHEVESEALAIARARQVNKQGYSKKLK